MPHITVYQLVTALEWEHLDVPLWERPAPLVAVLRAAGIDVSEDDVEDRERLERALAASGRVTDARDLAGRLPRRSDPDLDWRAHAAWIGEILLDGLHDAGDHHAPLAA